MITLNDVQIMISDFFNGDLALAGLAMFAFLIILIFALTKNIFQSLVVGLITTAIFSYMGIITSDMMILLIIIIVLGLAITARNVVSIKK